MFAQRAERMLWGAALLREKANKQILIMRYIYIYIYLYTYCHSAFRLDYLAAGVIRSAVQLRRNNVSQSTMNFHDPPLARESLIPVFAE